MELQDLHANIFLDSHVDCNFLIFVYSIPLMNVNTIILIIHSDIYRQIIVKCDVFD